MTGAQALRDAVKRSDEAYVVDDPHALPMAYWGWRAEGEGCCVAWLLSTPAIEDNRVKAARMSLAGLAWLHERFAIVVCITDVDHPSAGRWLRWLGFRERSRDGRLAIMYHQEGGRA